MELQALESAAPLRAPADVRPAKAEPAHWPEQAPPRPSRDEYIPGGKNADPPSGLYRIAHGQDGTPRIEFDDPEPPEPDSPSPEPPGDQAEKTTCNTDDVDREIQSLKDRREQLETKLRTAPEGQRRDLERQLRQVERELSQKDNDSYRRQNAVFTETP